MRFFIGQLLEFFFEVLVFFLQHRYLLLEREDRLPLDLQSVAFGVHVGQTDLYFLSKDFSRLGVIVFDEIFEHIFIELFFLFARQHHISKLLKTIHPSTYMNITNKGDLSSLMVGSARVLKAWYN
jgi:hypothetical protein